MSSCFFIGHRDTPWTVSQTLQETVEQYIVEHGVSEFIVGRYGDFDRMAAEAVIRAKKRHPNVMLTMLIPYHPAERSVELPPGFDNTFYPPGMETVPRRVAIVCANRYTAGHVDYLIAYAWHPASNARELVAYARKRDVAVLNLGESRIMGEEKGST